MGVEKFIVSIGRDALGVCLPNALGVYFDLVAFLVAVLLGTLGAPYSAEASSMATFDMVE